MLHFRFQQIIIVNLEYARTTNIAVVRIGVVRKLYKCGISGR